MMEIRGWQKVLEREYIILESGEIVLETFQGKSELNFVLQFQEKGKE